MKFGRQLAELVDPKFRPYCVAYNMLKTRIRETDIKTGKVIQTIQDVTSAAVPYLPPAPAEELPGVLFQEALNSELEKVNRFSELEQDTVLTDLRAVIRRIYSLDRSIAAADSAISAITDEIDRIAADVCSFAEFVNLNYTAFRKITKKEAKVHRTSSSGWFMANVARAPFMNVDFERMLTAISICYELLRTSQTSIETTPMARVALSSDRVMSAWISGDDLWEVKVALSKVMTLELVIPPGASRQGLLESILGSGKKSSIMGHKSIRATYYDTPWLESYKDQVAPRAGSSFSGGFQVEYEEETATVSLPSGNRFVIGAADWESLWSGKSAEDESLLDVDATSEVRTLAKAGFQPLVTSSYSRYVFYCTDESFGPIEVRVEENADFLYTTPSGSMEKLEDKNSKFTRHALYITVDKNSPKELPEWLREITGMPGVTEVPNFSKRVHGLFVYADNKIGAGVPFPNWAVRSKPPVGSPKLARPVSFAERPTMVEPVVTAIEGPTRTDSHTNPLEIFSWLFDRLPFGSRKPTPTTTVRDAMIKVEPKSFFAAERNLLDWTHNCVIVSGIAALHGGFLGIIVSIIPIIVLVWEIVLHRIRNKNMMNKEGTDYDDKFGPPLLMLSLLLLATDIAVSSSFSILKTLQSP